MKFAKSVGTPFLQNTTGRLLLIIAASIVVKRELANKTVNYDTKTKPFVPNGGGSVSYQKRQSISERTGFRSSRSQSSK